MLEMIVIVRKSNIISVDNADYVMKQLADCLRDSIKLDVSMLNKTELLQKDKKFFIRLKID